METGAQHARVELSSPARVVLRVLDAGVLVTSVAILPASPIVRSVAGRAADVAEGRSPPTRRVQVIGGSVTVLVALPFPSSRTSDTRLNEVAA